MRPILPLASILLCCAAVRASFAADVTIVEQWSGVVSNDALKASAPAAHAVADAAAWDRLWKAWRPDEAVPAVDFSKDVILVAVADGPNRARVNKITRDDKGNVTLLAMSTRMGGPGFGYAFVRVPRAGIQSVDNQPLPAAPATQPATAQK